MMTLTVKISEVRDAIRAAVDEMGLPAFSRSSGVPYTTIIHWKKSDYRPESVTIFEKLADAAQRHEDQKLVAGAPESKRDAA